MARLHDVTVGKFDQFKRVLADADLDSELVDFVVKRPELACKWVADLREQLNPPAPVFDPKFRRLFSDTPSVLEAFLVRNKQRNWGFTGEQIDALRNQAIELTSSLNQVITLDIWLGDLPTTFEELWSWNVAVHGADGTWRWDGLRSDEKHLRLLDATRYGNQPSARWVVLDLTANHRRAPKDVRDPANSAGLQLLSASALHPAWVPAIDYDAVLSVWLPGLQVTVPGMDAWQGVPILHWGQFDRTVDLYADWAAYTRPSYSVPVVREL